MTSNHEQLWYSLHTAYIDHFLLSTRLGRILVQHILCNPVKVWSTYKPCMCHLLKLFHLCYMQLIHSLFLWLQVYGSLDTLSSVHSSLPFRLFHILVLYSYAYQQMALYKSNKIHKLHLVKPSHHVHSWDLRTSSYLLRVPCRPHIFHILLLWSSSLVNDIQDSNIH